MPAIFSFTEFAEEIASLGLRADTDHRTFIFRLTPDDIERFDALCRERRLNVIDTIERQLADLAFVRLPSAHRSAERDRFAQRAVASEGARALYGVWAYFPWEAKVVHLLGPDDYFEVVTNRNQDKITGDEQIRLRAKRLGVVGLSVGGEAAVTVAQEHLCGEIVLADFDRLDLSNLNRLHAGCDELGLPKTTIAARRIAKIDPYLKVTVFKEGVTAENAGQFLDGLDLLIEECDNPQIKREVRLFAKERGVNVVYAADERGFFSVEPYRDFPELNPFHGRITQPQQPRERYSTALSFFRVLSEWIGGWDNLSERTRESLVCIGDDLCGYPQLASEARYAAGQIGHVARRLLLGERIPPYCGYLDLDDLVPSAHIRQ
ncbi:MAG TPA: ThiF family adenylyltransferase [Pyrinomonadaceae bacterium]|nr:ThiF family adenylyltransferase [Pyrinomonadaceae bacterium]